MGAADTHHFAHAALEFGHSHIRPKRCLDGLVPVPTTAAEVAVVARDHGELEHNLLRLRRPPGLQDDALPVFGARVRERAVLLTKAICLR